MTLTRRFFSATTLTRALLAAARHHQVNPDDLAYREIEKKHGFLKTPRGVVIDVDPENPTGGPVTESAAAETAAASMAHRADEERPTQVPIETAPTPPAEIPASSAEPESPEEPAWHPELAPVATAPEPDGVVGQPVSAVAEPVEEVAEPVSNAVEPVEDTAEPVSTVAGLEPEARDDHATSAAEQPAGEERSPIPGEEITLDDELRDAVTEAVDEMACLAGLRVQVASIDRFEDGLAVEIDGPDGRRTVARGGRALLAMQHLLPRLLFGKLGRSVYCRLDCDDFHAKRTEGLEHQAQEAAERVREGGRAWLLEPMAPDERRLVHMALAEVPDIETESVGEGFLKRVRVSPVSATD